MPMIAAASTLIIIQRGHTGDHRERERERARERERERERERARWKTSSYTMQFYKCKVNLFSSCRPMRCWLLIVGCH
jgi:hypothetical protein